MDDSHEMESQTGWKTALGRLIGASPTIFWGIVAFIGLGRGGCGGRDCGSSFVEPEPVSVTDLPTMVHTAPFCVSEFWRQGPGCAMSVDWPHRKIDQANSSRIPRNVRRRPWWQAVTFAGTCVSGHPIPRGMNPIASSSIPGPVATSSVPQELPGMARIAHACVLNLTPLLFPASIRRRGLVPELRFRSRAGIVDPWSRPLKRLQPFSYPLSTRRCLRRMKPPSPICNPGP